ncbi:MAG TPA: hypothetical protein VHG28_19220 [Longimicrobiaceae bacterium]|nr:hypothetical protein [Longimicrobiaceae bacterium]
MQQGSMGEVPGRRLTGPASRFDRYGVRHGLPYATDPGYDEPDNGYGEPDPYDDDRDDADGPPTWSTLDGDLLTLSIPLWVGWRRRYRRPPLPEPRPWPPRRPRPWPRAPLRDRLDRLGRLVSGARRIGTLRVRRTGERFPLYGARIGARSWRIVARPRGGMSREIVAMRPAEEMEAFPLGASSGEMEMEAFPLNASPREDDPGTGAPGTTRDGYRLRLPHAGVHTIMARLQPDQLRDLAGGDLPADPAPALVSSLARVARRARKEGTLRSRRSGQRLSVFRAPGYRILARPRAAREAEILLVKPIEGEEELVGPRDPMERKSVGGGKARQRYRIRGARVTIQWQPAKRLADLVGKKSGFSGVYVVVRPDGKLYVGESGNFDKEWGDRFNLLQVFGVPLENFQIYLGTLTADPDLMVKKFGSKKEPWELVPYHRPTAGADNIDRTRFPAWLRADVEQVLIRWLDRQDEEARKRAGGKGEGRLLNKKSRDPIWVADKGISVSHLNPPSFLQNFTIAASQSPYEIAPGQVPGA